MKDYYNVVLFRTKFTRISIYQVTAIMSFAIISQKLKINSTWGRKRGLNKEEELDNFFKY